MILMLGACEQRDVMDVGTASRPIESTRSLLFAGAHLSAKRVEPECDLDCSPVVEVAMLRVRRAMLPL